MFGRCKNWSHYLPIPMQDLEDDMTYEGLRSLAHNFGFDILCNTSQPSRRLTDACVKAEAMGRPPNRNRDHQVWENWRVSFFRMLMDVGAEPVKPCMCSKCWSTSLAVTTD